MYAYIRVTYKGEKLHAAPCASLSGSYRGYDYHAHSLFLRFHSMPLFLSGCVRERLPVFNCSESVLSVSIVHTHKQTHIPNVDPCVHWETKQSSFFVVSFGRRRARNIHTFFSKYPTLPPLGHSRILSILPQGTVVARTLLSFTRKISIFWAATSKEKTQTPHLPCQKALTADRNTWLRASTKIGHPRLCSANFGQDRTNCFRCRSLFLRKSNLYTSFIQSYN